MIVVDSIATEGYKTKKIAEMLKALGARRRLSSFSPRSMQKVITSQRTSRALRPHRSTP